jgi:hypothetical protein
MTTLANLLDTQKLFLSVVEAAQGELNEEQSKQLEELERELASKPDAIHGVLDGFENSIETLTKRAKEIAAAQKALKAQYERLEQYTIDNMLKHEITELQGVQTVLKLSRTAGTLEITDQKAAETLYGEPITEIKVSKERIKADLNAGIQLGCAVIKEGYSLRRKVKK